MGELPVDIIYDILSTMPVKSLDRFRCVCKDWCKDINEPKLAIIQMNRAAEEPIPIIFKRRPSDPDLGQVLPLFRIIKSKEGTTSLEAKKNSVLEFECNEPFPNILINVGSSCNGLLYLTKNGDFSETIFSVYHPLRNERYELPPIRSTRSSGLGYDASTNTFKMCVSVKEEENLYFRVHILGTDSWREIPQIPYYLMSGDGVFAHGCLYWLGYPKQFPQTHRFKVIRFDIRKEEFGLIDPPKIGGGWVEIKVVDLHGEVGLVYRRIHSYSMELWVLKENQWVIQCCLDAKLPFPCDWIDIVGLWNKSGDILVTADCGKQLFFVYSLESRGFHQVNLVGWEDGCQAYIHMYRSGLFSIPGMRTSLFTCSNPTRPCSNPTRLKVRSHKKRGGKKRKFSIPSKVIYRLLNFC